MASLSLFFSVTFLQSCLTCLSKLINLTSSSESSFFTIVLLSCKMSSLLIRIFLGVSMSMFWLKCRASFFLGSRISAPSPYKSMMPILSKCERHKPVICKLWLKIILNCALISISKMSKLARMAKNSWYNSRYLLKIVRIRSWICLLSRWVAISSYSLE